MNEAALQNGASLPSGVPGPVAAVAGAAFKALSAVRGARIFHPVGIGYRATLRVEDGAPELRGARLFSEPGEYEAVCRFSRGGGLPERVPDVLGLALRLPDVHGPGRHQDFLLATSASGPLLHHLLLPSVGGFFGQTFSSILPYGLGGHVRVVGARSDHPRVPNAGGTLAELKEAAARGDLRFQLMLAPLTGGWQRLAELHVGRLLPHEETERLAFTPWHTGGGIEPVGPLQGLRQPAYRGSQRGRGLRHAEIP